VKAFRVATVVSLTFYAGTARAGDWLHHRHDPVIVPQRTEHDAGQPWCVRNHAIPIDNGHHQGYYIGGGSSIGGELPHHDEGTWGWDYAGLVSHGPRVRLNWTHGRRYQSGTGSYNAEGPKPLEGIKSRLHGE
jgi:hypothetical protein